MEVNILQIKINLKIFLIILLFILTGQSKFYAIFMAFLVLHEIGHLLIGLIFGFKPKQIQIMPLGFSIMFQKSSKNLLQKFLVVLAGPAVNIILAIMLAFLPNFREQTTCIYANLVIGVFNLFPIYPLDGGRLLNIILEKYIGRIESKKIVHIISNIAIVVVVTIAIICGIYLKNIAIIAIALYLIANMIIENKKYTLTKSTYEIINAKQL